MDQGWAASMLSPREDAMQTRQPRGTARLILGLAAVGLALAASIGAAAQDKIVRVWHTETNPASVKAVS